MTFICGIEGCTVSKQRSHAITDHRYQEHTSTFTYKINKATTMIEKEEDGFTCNICQQTLKNIVTMKRHFTTFHQTTTILNTNLKRKAFTYEEGCVEAMQPEDISAKSKKTCYHYAKTGEMEPFLCEVQDDVGMTDSIYGFVKAEKAVQLLDNNFLNKSLQARIVFSSETYIDQLEKTSNGDTVSTLGDTNFEALLLKLRSSSFPNVCATFGPYLQYDDDFFKEKFEEEVALDYLKRLPHLFIGSILYTGTAAYLIVTCEAYGRSAELDVHLESDNKSKPSPYKVKGSYASLTIQVIMQADAGNGASKLILGAFGFSILVTASVILFPTSRVVVNVGPSFVSLTGVNTAKLFLVKAKVEEFKADECDKFDKIINLRQLTSYYNHHSTYSVQRASLFNDEFKIPATAFTLCSLPPKYGYGSSENSDRHIVSHLLKVFGTACISNNHVVTKIKFNEFFRIYNFNKENTKSLSAAVSGLQSHFDENNELNVLHYTQHKQINAVIPNLSSPISKANAKIAKNIFDEVARLCS